MNKLLLITAIIACTGPFRPVQATDPHLGVAIHMENLVGNPNYEPTLILPILPKMPFTVLRDGDAPNWRKYELTQGVYTLNSTEQAWIDAVSKAGYSIVFCLGFDGASDYTPLFYPLSPFPTTQATSFV